MKLTRECFAPKGAAKVADKQSDAVAYLYATPRGEPAAMVFVGRQAKPLWRYRFRSDQEREKRIRQAFDARRDQLGRKSARRAERTAWQPTYKIGDILRTCWGYEQTNIEYFEIVELRGKHAMLRELAQERVETQWLAGKTVPLPGKYIGESIRRLCQPHGIKIDNVRTAYPVETQSVGGVKVIPASGWSAYN